MITRLTDLQRLTETYSKSRLETYRLTHPFKGVSHKSGKM